MSTYPTVIGQQPQDWRQYGGNIMKNLPSQAALAMQMQQAAQGPSAIDFAPGAYQTAIMRQLEGPSMAENAAARSAIGQQFNSAIGNMASSGARAGFYSPDSVAQAGSRRPAAALANSFQQLEADRRKMLREGAAGVGRQLQGVMSTVTRREDAGARDRGDLMGQFQMQQRQSDLLRRSRGFRGIY